MKSHLLKGGEKTMTTKELQVGRSLHDVRISMINARVSMDDALDAVEQALGEGPFYLSVCTDTAWAGYDGLYVDFGTFRDGVLQSERLSHYALPLPETEEEVLEVLAGLVLVQHQDAA
jgi:hypothetical protein